MPQRRYYGWVKQRPDFRDVRFSVPPYVQEKLPASVDLSGEMGPVLSQGSIGSCGPNSACSLVMYAQGRQGQKVFNYSRLAVYYNTRSMMGTVGQDSGVDNRTMLKALNKYGYCPEPLWPYVTERYTQAPPPQAVAAAADCLVTSYAVVQQTPADMKGCLASGFPFLFGFSVYESFESESVARTGIVPMPGRNERAVGGHDVVVCGYDDATQMAKAKNSWGEGWGKGGYFFLPYAYLMDPNLSGDFWVINAVPGLSPGPTPPTPPGPTPGPAAASVAFGATLQPGYYRLIPAPGPDKYTPLHVLSVVTPGTYALTPAAGVVLSGEVLGGETPAADGGPCGGNG